MCSGIESPAESGDGLASARRANATRVLIALLLAALNLRLAIAIVGPLIEEVRADVGISSAVAGLLTTLPFACMGVFSFFGPPLIRRWGTRSVLGWSLAVIAAGGIARAMVSSPILLIGFTLPIGLGVALSGVVIPIVVKQYFSNQPTAATAAYTTSIALGLVIAGVTAVPVANGLGGWQAAFGLSAVPTLLALPFWITARVDDHRLEIDAVARASVHPGSVASTGTGIYLGVFFGLQSLCFAAIVSWGPALFEEAGWSPERASLVVSALGVLGIIASLLVLWLGAYGRRRWWLFGTTLTAAVALLGMTIEPAALGVLWIILFGLGISALLPLCLVLPLDFASTPERVGALTAWMLGLGHMIAALGPILTGALRDLSGGFAVPLLVLSMLALTDVVLSLAIPRKG